MATGYCDAHAVNMREMVLMIVYVCLGFYLITYVAAVIVKIISKPEKYRDKMTDLDIFMNRNRLGRDSRNQIIRHLRLQYECSYTKAAVLQYIPSSARAKIIKTLFMPYIEKVSLFKGCSTEFINQIVIRLHEEFLLPGEVIIEQGIVADQLYFVCHGVLEELCIGQDGSKETVSTLKQHSSFGEISILCNIPQPYTIQVRELCRLLRIDKQTFTTILEIFIIDGRKILNNLKGKESSQIKQLESDIAFHIGKREAELTLRVNTAVYQGNIWQLKALIQAGADPNETDYDGRSPLHIAAARGYEVIVKFLIQMGVDINAKDKYGNTPFHEAIDNGHDQVASLLFNEGASLFINDASSFLCSAVAKGNLHFVKRMLSIGIDPNSKDNDHQTPLHVAASKGLVLMAELLLDAGASVKTKDRWGNTPVDNGRWCVDKKLIKMLEDANSREKTSEEVHGALSPFVNS